MNETGTMMNERETRAAIGKAVAAAKTAYEFGAGSYTFAALSEILAAKETMERPDWIALYSEFAEGK